MLPKNGGTFFMCFCRHSSKLKRNNDTPSFLAPQPFRFLAPQPFRQARVSFFCFVVRYGDAEGFFGAYYYDELFAARYCGVEEVALEHYVVLGEQRDDDGGVFGALRFVYRDGVGVDELV